MTQINNYAQIEDGKVSNVIMWDGNTDIASGGWEPPIGATMVKLPRYPNVGDSASRNPDETWSFSAPSTA